MLERQNKVSPPRNVPQQVQVDADYYSSEGEDESKFPSQTELDNEILKHLKREIALEEEHSMDLDLSEIPGPDK